MKVLNFTGVALDNDQKQRDRFDLDIGKVGLLMHSIVGCMSRTFPDMTDHTGGQTSGG